jgi:hypothetical protein
MKREEKLKLVANFMGREPTQWGSGHKDVNYDNNMCWLTPVVEKIASLKTLKKDKMWFDITIQNFQSSKINYSNKSFDFDSGLEPPMIHRVGFSVYIGIVGVHNINHGKIISYGSSKPLIKTLFETIVKFIVWYNKQNSK